MLSAWIAHDLSPPSREVAEQRARAEAQQTHAWIAQYPKGYEGSPLKGMTVDQLTAHYLPGHLQRPGGSATASKGVLALAAVCGGAHITRRSINTSRRGTAIAPRRARRWSRCWRGSSIPRPPS